MQRTPLTALWACLVLALLASGARAAEPAGSVVPIKAITVLEGEWSHPLLGRGIVVGLRGTGDKGKEAQREIAEISRKLGVSILQSDLVARKAAIVMLSTTVEPFTRAGERFSVKAAAIEAESLAGGVLLPAALYALGPDGKRTVYAYAQGEMSSTSGATGTVIGGATLEREVPTRILDGDTFQLNLRRPDGEVAQSIATIVNNTYELDERAGGPVARVLSTKVVEVTVPPGQRSRRFGFLGEILNLPVDVEPPPLVVINEATGQVTITGSVRVSSTVITTDQVSIRILPGGENLGDLIGALNDAKIKGRDLVAIIRQLERAGALHAPVLTE